MMSPINFARFKRNNRSSSCGRSSTGSANAAIAVAAGKTTKSATTTPEKPAPPARSDKPVKNQLIKQVKELRELERQRDRLKWEVMNLAEANYAREPEFVRDRARIREQAEELARMVRHMESRYVEPVLMRLNEIQIRLAQEARRHEEMSEIMANRFLLANGTCSNLGGAGDEAAAETASTNTSIQLQTDDERVSRRSVATADLSTCSAASPAESYEQFIGNYIKLRKETSKKRLLADRLVKERDMLLSNITTLKSAAKGGELDE